MKRILACILALIMVFALMACGQTQEVTPEAVPEDTKPQYEVEPVQKVIHVLLPETAEGWEAAAAAEAMTAVEELIQEGIYQVETANYADAQQQSDLLTQIAAASTGDGSQAVVTMPAAQDMDAVFAQLLEANVAYALADVLPEGAAAASVANVYYDQQTIGAAMAAWMVEKGLTQDSKIVILQGFSEEEALRTDGFKRYLQGKLAYDGAVIETPWTTTENIVYSEMEGETAQNAAAYFTSYMEESDHAATKYIAAWDDAYLLGVLDALESEDMNADNKAKFLEGMPFLASCGGSEEMLAVLAGDSAASFGGLQTALYDTGLLESAVRAMADHLTGQVVEQDQPQPITWISAENANEHTGY